MERYGSAGDQSISRTLCARLYLGLRGARVKSSGVHVEVVQARRFLGAIIAHKYIPGVAINVLERSNLSTGNNCTVNPL